MLIASLSTAWSNLGLDSPGPHPLALFVTLLSAVIAFAFFIPMRWSLNLLSPYKIVQTFSLPGPSLQYGGAMGGGQPPRSPTVLSAPSAPLSAASAFSGHAASPSAWGYNAPAFPATPPAYSGLEGTAMDAKDDTNKGGLP